MMEHWHFLQEGYATALAPKMAIFDIEGNSADLPDSTCMTVIEKAQNCPIDAKGDSR